MSSFRVVVLARRKLTGPGGAGAQPLLGPCDDAALRAALALDGGSPLAVTVIAAGPAEREDPMLRLALALGAARAVRISDASLDGIDYLGVARVLAAAARAAGFDLLLAGDRSADEAQGAVGPAVAEALGVPHVTGALDVRLDGAGVVVERRDGGGLRTLRLRPPAVVTVARSRAPARSAMAAEGAAIEPLGLDALGIQAPELRHRARCTGRVSPARPGRAALILDGAEQLVERLRDEHLLEPP